MPGSVVIAHSTGENVKTSFYLAMLHLFAYEVQQGGQLAALPLNAAPGPRIAAGRNTLVRQFLDETTAEWLLQLDTDVVFPPDLISRLLRQADPGERPIVSGLYFGQTARNERFPVAFDWRAEQRAWEPVHPEGQLRRVDGVGAGCLLVHRSVYAAMRGRYESPYEWFRDEIWDGEDTGEDLVFCHRARVNGFPVFVDGTFQLGHVKQKLLGFE